MSIKIVYKLPVVEKTVVLKADLPSALVELQRDEKIEAENEKKQLEAKLGESYQKGWDDAEAKLQSKIFKDNEILCKGLMKAIETLENERNTIWKNCEQEIVKLVLAIARKVTCTEISNESKRITENVVAAAVDKVKGKKIAKICMNSADVEGLKLNEIIGMKGECEIVNDNDISPGGCRVVTDCGSVDARVETRWDEIMGAFGKSDSEVEKEE